MRTGGCRAADGTWRRVLTPIALKRMRADQVAASGAAIGNTIWGAAAGRDRRTYGYGMFRNNAGPLAASAGPRFFFGPGANGTHMFVDDGRGYSGFLMLQHPLGQFQQCSAFFEEVVRRVQAKLAADAPPSGVNPARLPPRPGE